ncbi:putative protein S-acyltransferase 7 [Zea mays]|uniref:S-acyltransferase n=1 Tax=Zea mays TaxID=4577 RepID=A0A1D6LF01_MAIZE|nr:putative protein S-acyltransferase 7 [Zea mays]
MALSVSFLAAALSHLSLPSTSTPKPHPSSLLRLRSTYRRDVSLALRASAGEAAEAFEAGLPAEEVMAVEEEAEEDALSGNSMFHVYFRKYGLSDDTMDFVGHALALHRDDRYLDEPALDIVKRMKTLLHAFKEDHLISIHYMGWVSYHRGITGSSICLYSQQLSSACMSLGSAGFIIKIRNAEQITIWKAMTKTPASIALIIYTFIAVWFVGGLSVFHLYLMSTNQTTYENFRYRYDQRDNPYKRESWKTSKRSSLQRSLLPRTTSVVGSIRSMV